MTVRVYRSTDASAPALTGQVGSLTALLDAVLVNGYGTQTAAGWTIAQTTANKRGYKQNTVGSNNTAGMCLYVDDTGPGTGAAREARACGFETMTAITPTGTGQFPLGSQSTIGIGTVVIRKSNTADATARPWTIVANGQTLYLFVETGDTTSPYTGATGFFFGDFKSYKANDQYAVMIIGRVAENTASSLYEMTGCIGSASASTYIMLNTMLGHYIARHWTGIGGSVKAGKTWDYSRVACSNQSGGGMCGSWNGDTAAMGAPQIGFGRFSTTIQLPYPHGPDQGLLVAPIYLNHGNAIRGYLYGLWGALHDRPLQHSDTITIASGNLNGKSLLCQYVQYPIAGGANSDACNFLVEFSDTWS